MSASTPPSASASTCSRIPAPPSPRATPRPPPPRAGCDRGGYRAGHEHLPPGSLPGPPGDPRAGQVDLPDHLAEALVGQPEPAGPERVGQDHVRARAEVTLVDRTDQAGVREVE